MYNESTKRATLKYAKNNIKRVQVNYLVSEYEEIKTYVDKKNIPLATFIKQAIREKMEKEN